MEGNGLELWVIVGNADEWWGISGNGLLLWRMGGNSEEWVELVGNGGNGVD